MEPGFSDLERSLGIATPKSPFALRKTTTSFSDLERSLGIATITLSDFQCLAQHRFSDLERSLGIATVGEARKALQNLRWFQ